ncbi:hypothetical protein N7466_005211 [Penicillium verhagenii]|uniref:uncharacterized protein n=1 Tax=Penicillium verhagenii TaxID=1562060 RepID=UPI0025456BA5|nr:uncharacterized protein N7466_005211 [Penicillium verhagenii]KAJ5935664.1 hypothetical protein N7466_005211 [Penicillium verhagenii]
MQVEKHIILAVTPLKSWLAEAITNFDLMHLGSGEHAAVSLERSTVYGVQSRLSADYFSTAPNNLKD